MPNEKEVMGICEAVRLYLKDEEEEMRRTNRGTPRIPHYIRKQGLTPLAEVFRKRVFPRVTRALLGKGLLRPEEEMPWEWRLVTVLCYLLPGGARGFPFVLVAPCTRGASRVPDVSHDDDRIVEAGVALAAGWSRPPPAIGEPTWDGPWGPARQALVEVAHQIVDGVCEAFAAGSVLGHPRDFAMPDSRTCLEWAEFCVHDFLLHPPLEPSAADKYRFIHYWDPARSRLHAWLRHAIQGQTELKQVHVGYFANGLLYPPMRQDGKVKIETVAFMVRHCGVAVEYGGRWPSDDGRNDRCIHQDLAPFIFSKDTLVVPGVYLSKTFRSYSPNVPWVVRQVVPERSKFYYPEFDHEHPHGNHGLSQRTSNLFVYRSKAPIAQGTGTDVVDARSGSVARSGAHDGDGSPTMLDIADRQERPEIGPDERQTLMRLLQELPSKHRDILTMTDLGDSPMTLKEAAKALGRSLGDIRKERRKAIERLREVARRKEVDDDPA